MHLAMLFTVAAVATFAAGASEFDLGDDVRASVDEKGGFVFLVGGERLAFAPFEITAPEDAPGHGHCSPRIRFRADGDALVAEVEGNERNFGNVAFGRCSEKPAAVYFGYGYRVSNPGSFKIGLNGHANASRFVGFDFTNGVSLVFATETPPDDFYHDPEKGAFGFSLSQPTRFTFVAGRKGVFDCALRYRKHFRVPAPAGFARKAGRFCVDSWNGTFNDFRELIRRAADDYGLRDDLLFYAHCWQRYGFDRHLPDVYPPSKTFGTAEDLKSAAALAHDRGWVFGVHLNIIDCYPDSPWFSWDRICHEPDPKTGALEPVKAWINPPHKEQSYRLLPMFGTESINYQMEQLHSDSFRPDTVFIDVTGSGSSCARTCRDRAGNVHSLIENTRENARMFDAARALCSGASFVSSEAPCDYMVGHLDGGDCQWMHLAHEPGAYRWLRVPGDDLEKTPWFPIVYHDRMSLHGVGYSARFEGARGEDCHGVDSDDYLSCEIMNGHSLMADCYNRDAYKAEAGILERLDVERCLRQTVRKYWLAQHIARELGTATVSRVEYVKGDHRHLHVSWSTGMEVFVNRAVGDWSCATGDSGLGEVLLPQYGFVAFNAKTHGYASIRRRGGRVVEESVHSEGRRIVRYVNPRGDDTAVNRLPVAPETVLTDGGGASTNVRVKTTWKLLDGQKLPGDRFQVSYWLLDPMLREYSPKSAAVLVATAETTLENPVEVAFEWPKDVARPRVLHVAVSTPGADPADVKARFRLLGTAAFYKRYRQGTFDAKKGYVQYLCPDEHLWERLFPPSEPVDFGWTKTREAFRLVTEPGKPDQKTRLPPASGNLLRDDLTPDNIGGFLGWNMAGDQNVRVEAMTPPDCGPDDPPAMRIIGHRLGAVPSDYKMTGGIFPLVRGQRYRLSAQVRTKGLVNMVLRFVIAPEAWMAGQGIKLPGDTKGEWVDVSWEGVLDQAPFRDGYACAIYACSGAKGFPDDAWLDVRAPRLEGPTAPGFDRLANRACRPLPLRVTPVDPLLSEIRADAAEMLFYFPRLRAGEKARLRATLAGKTAVADFGADGKAKAVFGSLPAGKSALRAEVVRPDGSVIVANEYRAFVRDEVRDVTPLRRLNNFVSEVFREPYAEGDHVVTLAKERWLYLAITDKKAAVTVKIDGETRRLFPYADGVELMRQLAPGRHVISISGRAEGEVVAHAIKNVYRSNIQKAAQMNPNFTNYCYGEEFFEKMGLFGGFNCTSFNASHPKAPTFQGLVDQMKARGVQLSASYGFGANDPRRNDYDGYFAYVTNQLSYKAGMRGQFDENSISPHQGLASKAISAEVWWRAYEEGRTIDVFMDDGAHGLPRCPELDIPEFSAYLNSGDGRSQILSEAYWRSPETPAEFEALVSFAKQQFRAFRDCVPAMPSRFYYLFNGWMMIGGWTSWYSPGTDMRAFNAEMLRILATDPAFADIGGAAFSTPACYEDFFRFIAAALRYYCIEGGTESFARQNGMQMWPTHLINGDFLSGFDGWRVSAAAEGSIITNCLDGVGTKWQGRQYPGRGYAVPKLRRPGNTYAVLTANAERPNSLRQRITGLEPGRVYQLTYAISDVATMKKGMETREYRKTRPVNIPYLNATVEGAEEIPELRHVYDDIGKYGRLCVFPSRVVFRARSSEAEVVFKDWRDSATPGARPGQQTMLNYVGVYPYYHRDAAQLEDLKDLTKRAKALPRR